MRSNMNNYFSTYVLVRGVLCMLPGVSFFVLMKVVREVPLGVFSCRMKQHLLRIRATLLFNSYAQSWESRISNFKWFRASLDPCRLRKCRKMTDIGKQDEVIICTCVYACVYVSHLCMSVCEVHVCV